MNLYDRVKHILELYPETRNSDKELLWRIWEQQGWVRGGVITKERYLSIKPSESYTRARRKVQEVHEHLRAIQSVQWKREKKRAEGGLFMFDKHGED